jgi:hypothetical protein
MKIEHWHRRQALCIASQLPDGPGDALAVLDCVRELVVTFLQSDTAEPAKAIVLSLIRDCQEL